MVGNAQSYLCVSQGGDSQVRRCHSPGLRLCGQWGFVLTLAAAAGWAAVWAMGPTWLTLLGTKTWLEVGL